MDIGLRVATGALAGLLAYDEVGRGLAHDTLSGPCLALALGAALLVWRPFAGAWLLMATAAYLDPRALVGAPVFLGLGAVFMSSPRARLATTAVAIVGSLGATVSLRGHPALDFFWPYELAPLNVSILAALWIAQAPRTESWRIDVTRAGLHALFGITLVSASTGFVRGGGSFWSRYADIYTCVGEHAGTDGRTDCDVLLYGFAWSPWLAMALLAVAFALFARRKTASLFVAGAAAFVLFAPPWRWTTYLGEEPMFFPPPDVMSCMRFPHAIEALQVPLWIAIVAVWAPWLGGMARALFGRSADSARG